MTTADSAIRERLAERYSVAGLRVRRLLWTSFAIWCGVLLVVAVSRGSWGGVALNLLLFLRSAMGAIEAWELRSRSPEDIADLEVRAATDAARPCPKCGGIVLPREIRCPNCRSLAVALKLGPGGIDAWMPIILLMALVGSMLFLWPAR